MTEMPVDLEMLLSASNHGFFPFSAYDSSSYCDNVYGRSLSFPHCVPRSPFKYQGLLFKKTENGGVSKSTCCKVDDGAKTKGQNCCVPKKKVSFADDKGFKLVEVREIPGAPKWADDVLTLLIGSSKRSVIKEKKWKIAFENPPWPEKKLEEALEKNKIALEDISVKEGAEDYLIGTVKVKNLAFRKKIFVRVTFDRWLSYIDVPCIYVKPEKTSANPSTYDTFHFNFKILPAATRYEVIEFCICFQCDDEEYWDNNGGINYRLIVEYLKPNVPDSHKNNTLQHNRGSLSSLTVSLRRFEEIDTWSKIVQNEGYW